VISTVAPSCVRISSDTDAAISGSNGHGTAPSRQQPSSVATKSTPVGSTIATRVPSAAPRRPRACAAAMLSSSSWANVTARFGSRTATTSGRCCACRSSHRHGFASRLVRPSTAQGSAQRRAAGTARKSASHARRPLTRRSCPRRSRSCTHATPNAPSSPKPRKELTARP
jgi:hypothetical protein